MLRYEECHSYKIQNNDDEANIFILCFYLGGSVFELVTLSAALIIIPGGVLPLYHFPGGSSSLQRHHQLPDRHCHCPVWCSSLLPGCLPARVQTTTCHH